MSINQSMHFKECSPEETVKKLKGILADLDIKVEEQQILQSEIGTHSMRVVFAGTDFGSNGKGVSKEYCTASAYAEFFERYQNGLTPRWKLDRESKYSFHVAFDERILSTPEIVADDNAFINFYFSSRGMDTSSFEEKVDAFEDVQKQDMWFYDMEGKYLTLPFYSVKKDKVEYLPYSAYITYYGSNGMCAGNTVEEALVQGLSEIFERVAQKRIFLEKPTLPDVPDEYIKQFPYVFEFLTKLREDSRYVCKIKDCSFGGKYPVAALIVLEKNTGKYGVKLGCHPDFGIAMERAFTEAAQGGNVFEYINRSVVDFSNTLVDDPDNICNTYKIGSGQYPYQIFGEKPTYEFTPMKDVSMLSNKEILKLWVQQITSDGYDILIRNASTFGFPSLHILIPGLSELQNADDRRFRAINTRMFSQKLLENPEHINAQNIQYIIATLRYFIRVLTENRLSLYFVSSDGFEYPGAETGNDFLYMLAMCDVFLGDYKGASEKIRKIYESSVEHNVAESLQHFYAGIYYYTSAMDVITSHEEVMRYMSVMFDAQVVSKIDDIFRNPNLVIEKQYPCRVRITAETTNAYNVVFDSQEKLFAGQIESRIDQSDMRIYFK